jgi:acyl-CoA synthetase (NDP forming)
MAPAITEAAGAHPTKPVLASVLGSPVVMAGGERSVPSFPFPESAVRALARVERYAEWRARPEGQTPLFAGVDTRAARLLASTALAEHWSDSHHRADPETIKYGVWLDPLSGQQLLDHYGIASPPIELATSGDQAVEAAGRLGYPAVLKAAVSSGDGPVRAGLHDGAEVAAAYRQLAAEAGPVVLVEAAPSDGTEVVVEVIQDSAFGPLVAFGTGGLVGRLLDDRTFRALPITDLDAHDMIRSVRSWPLLEGTLDPAAQPADLAALEELLLRIGRLVEDITEVAELHLDPVVASPAGAPATSVRIRLAPFEPRPERALRRLTD